MVENKTIKITPQLFSLDKKGKKSNSQKNKKVKPMSSLIKPNTIKKDFLKRIKEHQKRHKDDVSDSKPSDKSGSKPDTKEGSSKQRDNKIIEESTNEIDKAISYFSGIVEQKKKKIVDKQVNKYVNKTLKVPKEESNETPVLLTDFPTEVDIKVPEEPVKNDTVELKPRPPQPTYGCLKNGSLPTYKQYHNKTVSKRDNTLSFSDTNNSSDEVKMPIFDMPKNENIVLDVNENKVQPIVKQEPKQVVRKARTKKTEKIILGKNDKSNVIGVLIKNKKTRKNISTEHARLKNKKMADIKRYLKEHGLIQVGSSAPDDVIRSIYENAILSGKIKNINDDNMVYNYMNDK